MQNFSEFNNEKKTNKVIEEVIKENASLNDDVDFIGKIAKFPKNAKASKAYSFLEDVKINKNKTWYILIEQQNNELQMIKYNVKAGVNLEKFVTDLKEFYKVSFKDKPALLKIIEKLKIVGEDKFVTIKNIPDVDLGDKKLITRLTQDLITVLGK